jgi:hypothetical protein
LSHLIGKTYEQKYAYFFLRWVLCGGRSHLIGNTYEKKYVYFVFLGGFFVEAGSYDAESRSDSLHFEITRGWKVRHRIFLLSYT